MKLPDIRSLEEYRAEMRGAIERLDALAAFRLSVFGVCRIRTEYDPAIWNGLSTNDQRRLCDILARLRQHADTRTMPSLDDVVSMRRSVSSIESEDAAHLLGDTSPETVQFLSAMESALGGANQTQWNAACVLEALLNLADFKAQDRDGYSLATMFIDPIVIEEVETQKRMIEKVMRETE